MTPRTVWISVPDGIYDDVAILIEDFAWGAACETRQFALTR